MPTTINMFCDESCHLEHDGINVMGLGAVWCDKKHVREINERIREIKKRNGVSCHSEVKWAKVGPSKKQLYIDLINYFFDNDDLNFRVLIVPDKSILDHSSFSQTHDEWYYKMYFEMLKVIFDSECQYNVYIDIKDSHSSERVKKLHDVCCNDRYDFSHETIQKIQPIRSDEVQLMQIVDILLGAVTYSNRIFPEGFVKSQTKKDLIDLIKLRSKYSLNRTTYLKENKFNIFIWRPYACL